MTSATMEGARWWESSHRSLHIDKVENGYRVTAKYSRERRDRHDAGTENLEFVFVDLSSMMAFVNTYLTADPEELKSGNDSE